MMKSRHILSSFIACALFSPLSFAADYAVSKTIHIGGAGGWDYISCDPTTHHLFFPRQSHTQIVDASTGEVIGDIPDTQGSHGVAIAPDANRGFVSDRSGVTVFDLKTLKPLGTIAAGTGADAIIFDPASKCVVVMNGRSHNASFIDSAADISTAKATNVELDGRPEFAAADGKGKVFINIEDKSEIAEIDSDKKAVIATWKIDGGEEPSGLAIDAEHHHLFAGCHNKVMAILDTETGKTIATVPIGSGVDACAFDPGAGLAFASCGDGTVTAIKETSPGKFEGATIQTRPGARTMTVDTSTHILYLPAAEMEPATQPANGANGGGGGGGGRRGRMKPDSFMLIVVSPGIPETK
jgi:DNA-binding beta-propeller fold protein YncE